MAAKIKPAGAARAVRQRLDGKTSGSRFATGTIDGAIGAAVVEPLVIGAAALEGDDDYTLMDSFLNVALGSALGGGLHWGAGKISDRINKLPAPARDQAQRASIAQAVNDKEVNVTSLIDDVEKTNVAKVEEQAGKKIVYDSDGQPKAVDVVDISKDGTITVRDADGTEKILDAGDTFSKSPYDEDYQVTIFDAQDSLSSFSDQDLDQVSEFMDSEIAAAEQAGDTAKAAKARIDKKAVEIEKKRRAGEDVQRPLDPDMNEAIKADLAAFQKEIDDIRAKAEKRKNKRITAAEQKKLAELQEKISTRQSQLQEASDLVDTEQGVLTAQQADNIAEDSKLDDGGIEALLGRLAEHKDAVDEIAADKPVMDEIDLSEFEAENARLQEDLQNEEMQAVLPADLKKSIEETKQIDEKASKFEEISRAGAACILRR
jgi:hypothetical protein